MEKSYLKLLRTKQELACSKIVIRRSVECVNAVQPQTKSKKQIFDVTEADEYEDTVVRDNWLIELSEENQQEEARTDLLQENLHEWSLEYQIKYNALRDFILLSS